MAAARARIPEEVQSFIVKALACYDTPSEVAEAVKEHYGLELDRRNVHHYHPEHSRDLAKKWRDVFYAARKKFLEQEAEAAIAHQPFRLRQLDKIYHDLIRSKNKIGALQALEQAAKERGGIFTNARILKGHISLGIDELLKETSEDVGDDSE